MGYRRKNGQVNQGLRKLGAVCLQQNHTNKTESSHTVEIPQECYIMDKNRKQGTQREIKGTIKEVTGKGTGDKSKEVAGNIEKNTGKVQKHVGQTADQLRDAAPKRDDIDHRP